MAALVHRLRHLLVAVANAGTLRDEGPETRRTQVFNLTAFAALLLNTGFTIFFAFLDFSAFLPMFFPNVISSLGYLAALLLSSRGRGNQALWVLTVSTFWNLTWVGWFFGFDSGGWLYLILLPVLGALFVPRGNGTALAAVIVGGSIVFATVPLVAGDAPEFVAGPLLRPIVFFVVAASTSLVMAAIAWNYRKVAERAEARSEELLLNILPAEIAVRLKAGESPIADRIPEVSVLFCDIVGSTAMAEAVPADDLVAALDRLFSAFDDIADDCSLEKIKTIGDGYFAVAGLNTESPDVSAVAEAALRMRDELVHHEISTFGTVRMRFGLHVGPVVAGVIGKRKFSYDLWGDTVNVASRMESTGEANMIQASAEAHERLKGQYEFEPRGAVDIKGKGSLETFVLVGRRPLRL